MTKSASIGLDEFIFERLQELQNFEIYWKRSSKTDPANFPQEAMRGDWDEQLDLWCRNEWRTH